MRHKDVFNIKLSSQYNNQMSSSNSIATPSTISRRGFKPLAISVAPKCKTDTSEALSAKDSLGSTNDMSRARSETIKAKETSKEAFGENHKVITEKFSQIYQKDRKLGEGAHSVVYKFLEKKTKKPVAVKILKKYEHESMRDIKQSFLLMKQLDHPYIMKAYHLYFEEISHKCYLTSQICEYNELRKFMEAQKSKGKPISEQKVAQIIKKLLVALVYLKQKGVCHRDMKPQNILYDPINGDLKIIDFELSKMKKYSHQILQLWSDTGSLFYRAPQSFTLGYGESIDLWAVGVIAYELLTGKIPFYSSSVKSATEKICKEEINFDCLDISREAKQLLREMLQKNPKNRITPKQALKSAFMLKNSPAQSCKSSVIKKRKSEEPYYKKSETTQEDDEDRECLKFYDESFTTRILRTHKRGNGVFIIY